MLTQRMSLYVLILFHPWYDQSYQTVLLEHVRCLRITAVCQLLDLHLLIFMPSVMKMERRWFLKKWHASHVGSSCCFFFSCHTYINVKSNRGRGMQLQFQSQSIFQAKRRQTSYVIFFFLFLWHEVFFFKKDLSQECHEYEGGREVKQHEKKGNEKRRLRGWMSWTERQGLKWLLFQFETERRWHRCRQRTFLLSHSSFSKKRRKMRDRAKIKILLQNFKRPAIKLCQSFPLDVSLSLSLSVKVLYFCYTFYYSLSLTLSSILNPYSLGILFMAPF